MPEHAGVDLLPQAGDANLEELVQVAAEDREEPGTLESRPPGVLGAREDARVVVERRELAVEEPRLGLVDRLLAAAGGRGAVRRALSDGDRAPLRASLRLSHFLGRLWAQRPARLSVVVLIR